jgi:hypothetical protein
MRHFRIFLDLEGKSVLVIGTAEAIFTSPAQPYTRSLFDAVSGRKWISGLG